MTGKETIGKGMACEDRDEALLMLAHGALDRAAALRTRAHLLVCPRCRTRFRQMEGLTASLASVLSNPRLGARPFGSPSRAPWASVGLLAVLLTLLGGIVATEVAAAAPANERRPTVVVTGASCHSCHPAMVGGVETPKTKNVDRSKSAPEKTNLSASHCDR